MNHRTRRHISNALLLFLTCAAILLAQPLPAAADDGDWRYGVIDSTDDPAAATRLGASWTRVRFQWADVQADGPDSWEPPVDDEALATELDDGRMVIGLLIGIPDWARDRQRLPQGLYLPYDDPDNTWAVYVREAVSRYEGQIDHWVIWNEPDIDDLKAPGHTWDGSPKDFAQLVRVAYLVAKETNPDAVIHLGAFTYFWDPGYFGRFLDILLADPQAAENDYYFDVATAQLYFQPDKIYDVINAFRDDMTSRGLWKPIWLVETNAPPADDPYWPVPNWTLDVTLYEQAAFIPQAIASALAADAERIAVYKLKDVRGDRAANPEPFGLLRQDNSRRPAFDTYQIAIDYLGHAGGTVRERWDEIGQFRIDQGDQTTTVLFSRLPVGQEVAVIAESQTAELVDMWGKHHTVEAKGGIYHIALQPALCSQTIGDYCMIGGTVLYLVQPKEDEPQGELPREDLLPQTSEPAQTPAAVGPTAAAAAATPVPTTMPAVSPTEPITAEPAATAAMGQTIHLPTVTAPTPAEAGTAAELLAVEVSSRPAAPGTDNAKSRSGYVFLGMGLLGAVVLGGWLFSTRRRE